MQGGTEAAKFLPEVHFLDSLASVAVMDFLDGRITLEEALADPGRLTAGDARLLGEAAGDFLAAIHCATHVLCVPADDSERLNKDFENRILRDLQLEWVFGKAFVEEGAFFDEEFRSGLEDVRRMYRGEDAGNLALCHGDLHPGR